MDQTDIMTFLTIAKTKSFSKTAEELYLSQPTVSHRIKMLESELQVKLIERKKGFKQVELTIHGQQLVPIAQRWLTINDEIKKINTTTQHLELNIGSTDIFSNGNLLDFADHFLADPDSEFIHFNFQTHFSKDVYEALSDQRIDIGFVDRFFNYKNIITRPILKERMMLVQNTRAEYDHDDAIDPTRLPTRNEIFFNWGSDYNVWHEEWLENDEPPYISLDTYMHLVTFLAVPGTWAIVPSSLTEPLQQKLPIRVSRIIGVEDVPLRTTSVIVRKQPSERSIYALHVFREALSSYLQENYNDIYCPIDEGPLSYADIMSRRV